VYGLFQSSEKPLPPTQVVGTGIKGGVRLQWLNADKDIAGFYVYRSGGSSDSLELLTSLISFSSDRCSFVDTNRALTGTHVYAYTVRSENTSHVLSDFSDTVFVRPLISTQPLAPLDISVLIEGTEARIFWRDMTTTDDNIQGYRVYRREVSAGKKRAADSLLTVNYFTDSTLLEGRTYEYAMQTMDIFGGRSSLASSQTVAIHMSPPPRPAGLRVSATPGRALTLRWDAPAQEDLKSFRVFRYERGKKALRLGEVKSTVQSYTDTKTQRGRLYFYYVTAVTERNVESPPSDEVSVRPQ
jgi:fibronectin type 3 domain-containing protein